MENSAKLTYVSKGVGVVIPFPTDVVVVDFTDVVGVTPMTSIHTKSPRSRN